MTPAEVARALDALLLGSNAVHEGTCGAGTQEVLMPATNEIDEDSLGDALASFDRILQVQTGGSVQLLHYDLSSDRIAWRCRAREELKYIIEF